MRPQGIGGPLWVVRLYHTKNLVVPALLAGPKGGLDVLGRTIERLQHLGIVVADCFQHRREHGLMGGRRDRERSALPLTR